MRRLGSSAHSESGRVRITSVLLLLILVALVYLAVEVGGVFFRKMKLEEAIQQHISFAGQLQDDAIRELVLEEVREMGLPPQAQRVGLIRTDNPRAIRITIIYAEPVNLFVTQPEIPVRIQINRRF